MKSGVRKRVNFLKIDKQGVLLKSGGLVINGGVSLAICTTCMQCLDIEFISGDVKKSNFRSYIF